jgi:hypothetical protein
MGYLVVECNLRGVPRESYNYRENGTFEFFHLTGFWNLQFLTSGGLR